MTKENIRLELELRQGVRLLSQREQPLTLNKQANWTAA